MDSSKALSDIPADPTASEQEIPELSILSDKEWQKVVFEFNNTAEDYPKTKCIHDFFEEQSAKTPDAIALICASERISYAELNQRSNRLAHYLRKRGVQAETLVGIFLTRTPELLVAILGILKAGGAYVPLDPKYPKDRLRSILEDSKMSLILTENSLQQWLSNFSGQVIYLDSDRMAILACENSDPEFGTAPENLAYVLFTSGSTGRPKGVAIEHRSTATFLHWVCATFSKEQMSGVLFSTSVCFDLSVFEVFGTLAQGGKIIMAENALYLPQLSAKDEVTLINTVPSAMAELVHGRSIPASVKLVALAGEALPPRLVEAIYAGSSVELVMNLYGPTEDTTYSTYKALPRGAEVNIGRPISNTQAYVLDSWFRPVPIGVPGELYLAGHGLARCYYGRPELTLERFLPCPFSDKLDGLMYKTGDVCRWLPNGELEYRGRIDDQVKIKGFRIELGEVETAALSFKGVKEAAAAAIEDGEGAKRLALYVASDHALDIRDLKSTLESKLPIYMVPQFIVQLSELPRNANGKIEKKKLPAPQRNNETTARECLAPTTALEQKLLLICERILGTKKIGITDNLFDFGLDSLGAARVCGRIVGELKRTVTPGWLYEAPTVQKLAKLLDGETKPGKPRCLVTIQKEGSRPPIFGIHNGAGLVMWLHVLARNLGSDQPFYGLQPQGRYGDAEPLTSIEDMAEIYLSEIRTVQPHGPYHLFGSCFGMVVAFEIAQRLHAAGETVALLVNMNGVLPGFAPFSRNNKISRGESALLMKIRRAFRWRWAAFKKRADASTRSFFMSRDWPVPEVLNRRYFNALHEAAECRYVAKHYDGEILVLCSYSQMTPASLGWTKVCDNIDAQRVAGERFPDRTVVAARMKEYMAKRDPSVLSRTA